MVNIDSSNMQIYMDIGSFISLDMFPKIRTIFSIDIEMIFPWFSDLSSCCSTSALRVMGQAPRVFQGPWQRRTMGLFTA